MKKDELVRQIDTKATSVFITASVGLTAASALVYFTNAASGMNGIVKVIFQAASIAFMVFAYVMTVKGFSAVNKSCKLNEKNEYYYFGKNMTIFSILSIILSIIAEIIVFMLYIMLSVYKNDAENLTPDDTAAAGNLRIITSIVVIAAQLVSIAMPYIFYMWHIHKISPKADRVGNFALFTMFVMIVQSAIVVLNSAYSIKGGDTSFLSSFAEILKVIEYLVLTVFFVFRKKSLAPVSELKIEE